MDPEQFKQLITAITESQTAMMTQIAAQLQPQRTATPVSFSSIAPFEHFDPRREKFSCYLERFENYYTMKSITEPVQIAQPLCVSIGSTHYNSLSAFLCPEKPVKSLSLDELVDAFKKMLIPKKSVVVTQHYFLSKFQKDQQTIAEYVADLQRDLAECEFFVTCPHQNCKKNVPTAEIFLRAQFIRGLRDNWLREQILQSNVSTFDNILAIATALEASRIESKELTQRTGSSYYSINSSDTNIIESSLHHRPSRSRNVSRSRPGSRSHSKGR